MAHKLKEQVIYYKEKTGAKRFFVKFGGTSSIVNK